MIANPDVVIVGGAAMGSATAYYLKNLDPNVEIMVIERDPTYRFSSTVLSDGNVRVQFNLEENIQMSQFALEAIEGFSERMAVGDWKPEPSPRYQGNLFLTDESSVDQAQAGLTRQRSFGCEVEWLEAVEIRNRFPVYAGAGYLGGTYGARDGSLDPNAVLQGYLRRARALGVQFITGQATAIKVEGGRIAGVALATGDLIQTEKVVNATGAWCAPLAATAGVDLPVKPVMRTVYVIDTHLDHRGHPSVFLPSGLYVLPEGEGRFAVGWSLPDDPVGEDFTFNRQRFDEIVWPELATQLPAFEALHLASGWTGLYEVNTLDGNGIIGEWPDLPGMFLANGFSGHGFQHCHAVGRHLAELILGRRTTLDLSRLGPLRILEQKPLYENPSRII
ncbi:MAG TPA: FAD-binding oxidoreductase [Acidimicrobiia bacterium]|nr:FAD-binding oxidoreductase [Acidimicrobiia bacterium]